MEALTFVLGIVVFLLFFKLVRTILKKEKEVQSKKETATPPKMRVWTVKETYVAAYLALYGWDTETKSFEVIALYIGRTLGSLLGKINRLETIEGKPQAISDRGQKIYNELKEISQAEAKMKFYKAMISLTLDASIVHYYLLLHDTLEKTTRSVA